MKRAIAFSILLMFGFILLVLVFGLGNSITQDTSPNDSDALYGGIIETNYPTAGFLYNIIDGKLTACGHVVLGQNTVVTAAHCVDSYSLPRVGLGFFTLDTKQTFQAYRVFFKDGWLDSKLRSNDLAIVITQPLAISEIPTITTPYESCDFRVVAYGRTERPEERTKFPRKSAKVCIFNIDSNLFQVVADRSNPAGVCFGDSGSPIFVENTSQVVGLIVSIQKDPTRSTDDQCDFGNVAYAIRLDQESQFLSSISQISDISAQQAIDEGVAFDAVSLDDSFQINQFELTKFISSNLNLFILSGVFVFLLIATIILYGRSTNRKF